MTIYNSEYCKKYRQLNLARLIHYHQQYWKKNRKELLLKKKVYYQQNKERILRRNEESRFLGRYGITTEEKKRILISQGNRCAICQKILDPLNRNTHVDHDHQTNTVRAILCLQCNGMLGHAKDNIKILQQAILYLKKHKQIHQAKEAAKKLNLI